MTGVAITGIGSAAGARELNVEPRLRDRKLARTADRRTMLALAAALDARDQAALAGAVAPERLGTFVAGGGRSFCAAAEVRAALDAEPVAPGELAARAWSLSPRLPPLMVATVQTCMAAAHVAIACDARGPSQTILGEAAGSLEAIGRAANWIRRGEADAVLAGGAESLGDPVELRAAMMRAAPGTTFAEGAAMVALEDRERAAARGAKALAEVAAFAAGAAHGAAEVHATCRRLLAAALGQAGAQAVSAAFVSGAFSAEELAAARDALGPARELAAAGAVDIAPALASLHGCAALLARGLDGALSLLVLREAR